MMNPSSRPGRPAISWLFLLLCSLAVACQRQQPAGAPTQTDGQFPVRPDAKPVPPLSLPEPVPPSSTFAGQDLRKLDAHALLRQARQLGNEGNVRTAAVYQYWGVAKTGVEQYDLACYLARLDEVDAAFYWLQVAGLEDGVDAAWTDADGDLVSLRRDSRWPAVRKYLDLCTAYWVDHGKPATILVLPKNYDGKTPLPVLVWLNGSNSGPDFRDDSRSAVLETAPDRLNVAVLGVSSAVPLGKAKFNWSEEPEQDYRRLREALKEVGARVRIQSEKVILVGFSQGGQVGLEVAARHPEVFAGAIAFCPGAGRGCQLEKAARSGLVGNRGFVIVTGRRDSPARLDVASADAKWLRGAGAKVEQNTYSIGHTIPGDLGARLPEWVRFIEDARGR